MELPQLIVARVCLHAPNGCVMNSHTEVSNMWLGAQPGPLDVFAESCRGGRGNVRLVSAAGSLASFTDGPIQIIKEEERQRSDI